MRPSAVTAAVLLGVAAGAGCAGNAAQGSAPPPDPLPVPALAATGQGPPAAAATADPRRWIAGDLHLHIAPLDGREGVRMTIADLAATGRAAGLEYAIVTPHVHRDTWREPARRRAWQQRWRDLAAEARAVRGLTIIPGAEYTAWGYGHFGISGADLGTLAADDALAGVADAGGFIVINHPFALPTRIPGIPISDYDLSFRPWTHGRGQVPPVDGVEVWNLPLGLANLVSRPGGRSGEQRAFAAADELARRTRRRVTAVGGSDNHRSHLVATTWVLAADASEAAVLAALRAGATCVGSPEAGTLQARGDADPTDAWARTGDSVAATGRVELRWSGRARLFVDGVDAGEHDGGFVHDDAAGIHTYRIEQAESRCGFVYANLD